MLAAKCCELAAITAMPFECRLTHIQLLAVYVGAISDGTAPGILQALYSSDFLGLSPDLWSRWSSCRCSGKRFIVPKCLR
jgi:hypothetical protein